MFASLFQLAGKKGLAFICCIMVLFANAQDFQTVVLEAQQCEAKMNEQAALEKFKLANKLQPSNILPLVKCSELYSRIGFRIEDKNRKDFYYASAKNYALAALKLQPTNSDANCCVAMALGRIIINKRGSEQISIVRDIKYYATQAIKYNPENYKAWHVLGRWHYELAQLNFIEKTAVKLFYGGLPDFSLQASIEAFEKCLKIQPLFLLNYMELAKSYEANDQQEKAVKILKEMMRFPDATEDDKFIKKQAEALILEWQ